MNKQIEDIAREIIGGCDECSKCDISYGCMAYYYANMIYNLGYRKASDVAREIFEEIGKFLGCQNGVTTINIDKLIDLKKKYESEADK